LENSEKAHEQPNGLFKSEDGKLHFPNGKEVRGVNSGIFAQTKNKDTNDLIDEVKGKMKKEADERAVVEKK
jgi:hypothetical protein